VNARKLYRTVAFSPSSPLVPGAFFHLATISNNTDTTYGPEQIQPDGLGPLLQGFVPPFLATPTSATESSAPMDNPLTATVWRERMWVSDGLQLAFSEIGLAETFFSDALLDVQTEDGGEIRALYAMETRLLVGKTTGMFVVTGSGPSTFAIEKLSEHPCVAGSSIKGAEDNVFWFGGDNFYRSDGMRTAAIGDTQIRDIVDKIPQSRWKYVVAEVFPTLGWYVVSISQTDLEDGASNELVLVYNYRSNSWATFTHPSLTGPLAWAHVTDEDGENPYLLASGDGGGLYRYNDPDSNDDDGDAIDGQITLGELDLGAPDAKKAVRRVYLLTDEKAAEVTLNVYRDGRASASKSRTVSLYFDGSNVRWKPYNLSTLGDLGTTIQPEIVYEDAPPLDIEAIGVEYESYERPGVQPR
jgi:hypothetical protein